MSLKERLQNRSIFYVWATFSLLKNSGSCCSLNQTCSLSKNRHSVLKKLQIVARILQSEAQPSHKIFCFAHYSFLVSSIREKRFL